MKSLILEILSFSLRITLAIVFFGAIFGSILFVYAWATTSHVFSIEEILVQGNNRSDQSEINALADINQGQNIFLTDTDSIENRILKHPWVRDVIVRREVPDRLIITLREYEAAVMVSIGSLYIADHEGSVFKRAGPEDDMSLPIISGIDSDEGEEHLREEILRGMQMVMQWEKAGKPGDLEISQIHLNTATGVTLTVVNDDDEQSLIVHIAEDDIESRLSRLSGLLAVLSERRETPKEVFLDNRTRPQWVVARVDE